MATITIEIKHENQPDVLIKVEEVHLYGGTEVSVHHVEYNKYDVGNIHTSETEAIAILAIVFKHLLKLYGSKGLQYLTRSMEVTEDAEEN